MDSLKWSFLLRYYMSERWRWHLKTFCLLCVCLSLLSCVCVTFETALSLSRTHTHRESGKDLPYMITLIASLRLNSGHPDGERALLEHTSFFFFVFPFSLSQRLSIHPSSSVFLLFERARAPSPYFSTVFGPVMA